MNNNNDEMTPLFVGAPTLIPKGNLSDNPGSFAGMRKALDDAKKRLVKSHTSLYPNFVSGYGGPNAQFYNGHGESMSVLKK